VRETSDCDAVDFAATNFADHRVDSTATQSLFHRPEKIAAMCNRDGYMPFWRETKGIEPGAMQRSAFGKRHVLDDPEEARRRSSKPYQSQGKPADGRKMSLARCRNLMQGAAHKPAAEHRIDSGNPKRQGVGAVDNAGWPLES
jgi:hypothetical protein